MAARQMAGTSLAHVPQKALGKPCHHRVVGTAAISTGQAYFYCTLPSLAVAYAQTPGPEQRALLGAYEAQQPEGHEARLIAAGPAHQSFAPM
jgi:hypothetical protein